MSSRRKRLLTLILTPVVLLLTAGGVAIWRWTYPPPLPLIPYGPTTTVLEHPRHPDGTIDYLTPFRQKIEPLLASEENAARLFVQAVGPQYYAEEAFRSIAQALKLPPLDEGQRYLVDFDEFLSEQEPESDLGYGELHDILDQTTAAPWTGDQNPLVSAWLGEIAEPLALFEQASHMPLYAMPVDLSEDAIQPPLLGLAYRRFPGMGALCDALSAQAFLRLGRGEVRGCWEDGLTLCRLAGLAGMGPGIMAALDSCCLALVGNDILKACLTSKLLTRGDSKALLGALQVIRIPRAQNLFEQERLAMLDVCMYVLRSSWTAEFSLDYLSIGKSAPLAHEAPGALLDPEALLTTVNQYFDTLLGFTKTGVIPDLVRLRAYVQSLKEDRKPDWSVWSVLAWTFRCPSRDLGGSTGRLLSSLSSAPCGRILGTLAHTHLRHFFLLVAVTLECDRANRGHYPDSLESLAPLLPSLESEFAELAQYVDYSPAEQGFRLGPSSALLDLGLHEESLADFEWDVGPERD